MKQFRSQANDMFRRNDKLFNNIKKNSPEEADRFMCQLCVGFVCEKNIRSQYNSIFKFNHYGFYGWAMAPTLEKLKMVVEIANRTNEKRIQPYLQMSPVKHDPKLNELWKQRYIRPWHGGLHLLKLSSYCAIPDKIKFEDIKSIYD